MPIGRPITQKNLDDFKSLYPRDSRIQALTLSEVLENTSGRSVDWSSVNHDAPARELAAAEAAISVTPCQRRIGFVIYDVVGLAVGAVSLRSSVNARTIDAVADAAGPVLNEIQRIVESVMRKGASKTDVAWGVFKIMKTLYSGECLGAVLAAFTASLTWWDAILYGVTSTATILVALATNGVALVAEVILLLASFGFLVSDLVKAYQACTGEDPPTLVPSSGSFPNGRVINSADSAPATPAGCAFNGKLYLFWKAADQSNWIYESASADGQSWPAGQVINSSDATLGTPAACVFNGKLYLFWRANNGSNRIYYSASADGEFWPSGQVISSKDVRADALAACAFNGKLYLFWKDVKEPNRIYYSASVDGQSWPDGQVINSTAATSAAPAACVLNGKLYLFWRGNNGTNRIYYSASADGQSWPKAKWLSGEFTADAVAACADDANIHLFWRETGSASRIFYGTLANGIQWLGSQSINGVDSTSDAPSACVFQSSIYSFWRANDPSGRILWSNSVLPGSDPLPFEPVVAVATANGNYVTVVDNGGLGGGNVAIQTGNRTIGPMEKFSIRLVDPEQRTFALLTSDGYYVSAANGGGVGGPSDASCPIHTNATAIGAWEKLIFEQQVDGTYAICTTDGYYLTAVKGGGIDYPKGAPIYTLATELGAWETFTLVSLDSSAR